MFQYFWFVAFCSSSRMVSEEVDVTSSRQAFYRTIYRQCFSPDGDWLVAVDSLAYLYLFDFRKACEPDVTGDNRLFRSRKKLTEAVFALTSVQTKLVCGDAVGRLTIYDWEDIIQCDESHKLVPTCQFFGFKTDLLIGPNEINATTCIDNSFILYAGSGDNAIRLTDIERADQVISTFKGHAKYVNELAVHSPHVFLSSSEDGTVRLWDVRSEDICVFDVASHRKLRRRNCGIGVCALDAGDEFLICGGDMEIAMWHISSRSLAQRLTYEDRSIKRYTVAKMGCDRMFVGGSSSRLLQFDYMGQYLTSVRTSLRNIYSVECNSSRSNEMTTAAGDSSLINVFFNSGYVSLCLSTD
ncbi:unnamed protein product [Thelazia callipaeda]|uniref:WD_REPEATS_REGION domain-containing protein n=1 Tax=Thelazia callipaeda TaxID=103827 RepID=A0A0N5CY08_THECL|nr:unnamed protein product [Thelazia callipaeda]